MINTIRADFYRLFHTKGFWISQVLLILFIITSVAGHAAGGISINNEFSESIAKVNELQWTGIESFQTMGSQVSISIYMMIPLFVIIVGRDFSYNTLKNNLTVGISRTKYFFSKYITLMSVLFVQMLYYYGFSFLTSSLLNGLGDGWTKDFIIHTSRSIGFQFLLLLAIFTLGITMIYITSSAITAIILVITLPILINVLQVTFTKISWLKYIDFSSAMTMGIFQGTSDSFYIKTSYAALIFIVSLCALSLVIFKQKEI